MEAYDYLKVQSLGSQIWRTKDLGGNRLTFAIDSLGRLMHNNKKVAYPVKFNGYIHFYAILTFTHKVPLGSSELVAKLTLEENYRARMYDGICMELEKRNGDTWVRTFSSERSRQFLDSFHICFPPLSQWKQK